MNDADKAETLLRNLARRRRIPQTLRSKAVLHAGAIFLVDVDAGRDVQQLAFAAALDEIDADADLVNLELLVEPEGDGFRVRRRRWT